MSIRSIGLDIGTTTICGILMDAVTGELLKKITLPNASAMEGKAPYEKLQDPQKIEETCQKIICELSKETEDLVSIGVTGQMHGILYLDKEGQPVSPLITWQDGRGDEICEDGKSYAKLLSEKTGYHLATGFGAVTHYYNTVTGKIPQNAVCFCTIPDYMAMVLAQKTEPLLHPSMAASIGLYKIEEGCFDLEKIEKAGMDSFCFPKVSTVENHIGCCGKNIKISPAFGDNQASFLGAVDAGSNILVNVGTGSQVSVYGEKYRSFPNLECRPFMEGTYIYAGASLCGGYSYSLLKNFFEETIRMCGGENVPDIYDYMNAAGQKAKESAVPELTVDTRFKGSRKEPELRGKIEGISPENFLPGVLVLGVLKGISSELYQYYQEIGEEIDGSSMTGSGNGIRRNPLLQEIVKENFDKELRIPVYEEEASCGAALFSLYTAGIANGRKELQEKVKAMENKKK